MKRLLNILFVIVSILTVYVVSSKDTDEQKPNENIGIAIDSPISTLDIPLNNQAHKYSSKEFTVPGTTRTINNTATGVISIIAPYTLHKRVNNISSHSTNYICNTLPHRYISYGVLRV